MLLSDTKRLGVVWWMLPWAVLLSAWEHRALISRLTWREIESRYKGSMLGLAWAIISPVFLLAIYTFVFSVVFQARWGTLITSKMDFALILFTGLILFNVCAECFSRAPTLILAHTMYVKKVIFPLEILPLVTLLTALFNALLSFVVLSVFFISTHGLPPLTILYLPLLLIPLLLFIVGITCFFSALGVYLRDLQQAIGLLITVLMFCSPLFYPLSAVPPKAQMVISLNPLTGIIEQARALVFEGLPLDWTAWSQSFVLGVVAAWFGFAFFMKTKKGFADVL